MRRRARAIKRWFKGALALAPVAFFVLGCATVTPLTAVEHSLGVAVDGCLVSQQAVVALAQARTIDANTARERVLQIQAKCDLIRKAVDAVESGKADAALAILAELAARGAQ